MRVLRETRPTIVILPLPLDLHPDHAASAPLVRPVLGENIRTLSYVVHAHAFPQPFFYSPASDLDPPGELANLPWQKYALSRATEQKKLATLRMYRTQRRDPHLYLLTEASVRRNELFVQDD
jgi:LmbE family N-acetylglucosaminyl deacetylase